MKPSEKKRRGEWSEAQLKAALHAVNNKEMSQRQAADAFSIPRRTLRNHLKSGSIKKITGRIPILDKSQEQDLTCRIIRLAQVGMPLTPKLVRKQAYEFCKANKIPNCFDEKKNIAGKKWLRNFVKRNPEISLRKAQIMNPARAQKLNKPIVTNHFDTIKKIYDELDIPNHPERLYNTDEKGCRLTLHHQQQVLAAKGTKRVHFIAQEHAENVTIAMCVNATGNSVPPMIIFKGKRLRPEFCDNLPAGSVVRMAPKGCMTTELFVDFIDHLGQYKSPGKCLLIFDGASSHLDARIVDAADNHNIVLYCLPSNTTHELQPLDKSVNRSYEHYWDEEVLLYAYQHPNQKLTKMRFNKIFTKVWSKCMTPSNIVNGFRATGLYPYDPNVIPEEAFAPSMLTHLPDPGLQASSTYELMPDTSTQRVHSDLRISVESPRRDINSDTNVTDFEENDSDVSQSLLTQNQFDKISHSPIHIKKLVDYSSSNESLEDNSHLQTQEQRWRQPFMDIVDRSAFNSPIPTTSGKMNMQIRAAPRLNSSTSDGSEEEPFNTILKKFQYPSRFNDIYTSSSSGSDEENLNPQHPEKDTAHVGQDPVRFEDSDDNLPLSKIKEFSENFVDKTPFQKQIPTPNFATIKTKPRRKALNYIGQKITKNLFDVDRDKTSKKTKNQKGSVVIRGQLKVKRNTNETKKMPLRSKKVVKKITKGKGYREDKTLKVAKKKDTEISQNEAWYCQACNTGRVADMRQCKECQMWYHEECIGLTKEDIEQFVCSECN